MEITTERLRLRQWRDADREPFAAMNADPDVMTYFPSELDRRASDALVDRCASEISNRGYGLWALEVRDSVEFIGFTGLSTPGFDAPFTPCVEVGWRLARQSWGYGYATEAATASLNVAFDDLGLDEVVAFTAAVNLRSRAVMERLAMTRDERDDFDHPRIAADHWLAHHVLYRASRDAERRRQIDARRTHQEPDEHATR